MINLLIVDDERVIADGLQSYFEDNKELDLDIDKAYSVSDAMYIMENVKIDIVITDICMPETSGIEFHDKIIKKWPRCRVIYLTGHKEFDYVHSAIRNESVDFILKSEGYKPVLEAVKKAIHDIAKDMKNKAFIEKAERQMIKALPMLQHNYFTGLLEGIVYSEKDREKQFDELHIELDSMLNVFILTGRIDTMPEGIYGSGTDRIKYKAIGFVAQHLAEYVRVAPAIYREDKLVWFIQPLESLQNADSDKWAPTVSSISGLIDSIQQSADESLDIKMSFILPVSQVSWKEVGRQFSSMEVLLNKTAGVNSKVILNVGSMENSNDKQRNIEESYYRVRESLKKISLLETYLSSNQRDEFSRLIDETSESIDIGKTPSYNHAKEVYYSVAVILLSYINKNNIHANLIKEYGLNMDTLLKLEEHTSWDDAFLYLKKLAEKIFDMKSIAYEQSSSEIVKQIKRYIDNNLDKDLSLLRISQIFYMNRTYLSRFFKQITGQGISDYIADIKLEKSIDLLKNTNMKVTEISEALGFGTPSYFAAFFRKYTNISPSEYRSTITYK